MLVYVHVCACTDYISIYTYKFMHTIYLHDYTTLLNVSIRELQMFHRSNRVLLLVSLVKSLFFDDMFDIYSQSLYIFKCTNKFT